MNVMCEKYATIMNCMYKHEKNNVSENMTEEHKTREEKKNIKICNYY
jgi:hypothetical protein